MEDYGNYTIKTCLLYAVFLVTVMGNFLVLSNQLLLRERGLGELNGLSSLGSSDILLLLLGEHLNMARGVHVSVDSAVSSVGSASSSLGLVALNVGENELLNVQGLRLSVGNQVLQETDDDLGGLDGPATLSVLELISLSGSSNTTVESAEGNASLLLDDSVQVLNSISNSGASYGSADLEGVLEVNADVCAGSLAS